MDTEEADKNALRSFLDQAWAREARQRASSAKNHGTLVSTQSEVPHLEYWNEKRDLTFRWDGDTANKIEVSHGRTGQFVVVWRFEYVQHRPPLVVAGARSLVLTFTQTCDNWIDAKEDAR